MVPTIYSSDNQTHRLSERDVEKVVGELVEHDFAFEIAHVRIAIYEDGKTHPIDVQVNLNKVP